ncbi:MAG: ArsR/SmtB family transcription factor [Myxococcaceae bacterium]
MSRLTTQTLPELRPTLSDVLRALDNQRRLQILQWLKEPTRHFRPQVDGDLVEDGVCGLLIAEKLGLSQPTVSEHMRLLVQSGLVRAKRIKQWTFYRRDETRVTEFTRALRREL